MKSIVRIILILLFFNIGCSSPPKRNCNNFKTGKFKFITVIGNDTLITTSERMTSLEVERFKGKQDTASIRWINDCEYVLKKLHPENRAEEKSVHVKILTTTDSSYIFEFSAVGEPNKLRGTAFKTH